MSNDLPSDDATGPNNPVHNLPAQDHGAKTLRNYRYQSAYAVVLLIAAAAKKNNYTSIWCEQEDDLLCQIEQNRFDSFQVKTQQPELGPWKLTDDAFTGAIRVFLRLDHKYPTSFRFFNFVSNTECLETEAKTSKHLCPKRLADAARTCTDHSGLSNSVSDGFDALRQKVETTKEALFKVISRLNFVKSPDRDSFIAELAQNHLRELEWCRLPQPRLDALVRSLIEMVDSASSLSSQSPARHYPLNTSDTAIDPQLISKEITVESFILRSRELVGTTFRYLPTLTTKPLDQTNKNLQRFRAKLREGGLEDYADSLRNQTLSSEAIFLDLATRGPEGEAQLAQIENVVKAECDAAHLRAAQGTKPFGQRMLIDVQDRLQGIAKNESAKVGRQPYEALMGMAGILTESCPVWWSEKFDVDKKS